MTAATDTEVHRDPRAGLPTRLHGYAAMHDAISRDAARLVSALARLSTRDEALAIAAWLGHFEAAIVHHHVREDEVVFPAIVGRDRTFDGDAMFAEHVELDRVLEALRCATAELASMSPTSDPDPVVRDRAVVAARDLEQLMADHLRVEEEMVFPRLIELFSAEEFAVIDREVRKGAPLRAVTFLLPWVLDDADPRYATTVGDDLPFLFRVLHRLVWARSYRELSSPLR